VQSIALHTVSIECLEWIVLIIPFIHSRHNTKDRSLGVGRDIKTEHKMKYVMLLRAKNRQAVAVHAMP